MTGEEAMDVETRCERCRFYAKFEMPYHYDKRGYPDGVTADVVPVVHGTWIPVDEKMDAFDCSECDIMVRKIFNFCPHCGAKMGVANLDTKKV